MPSISPETVALISMVANVGMCIGTFVIALGVFIAFEQVKAVRESSKAVVLMRLGESWRDEEIYSAITYIHELRRKWKSTGKPAKEWGSLAKIWVNEHAGKNLDSADQSERNLACDWMKRRMASQFLSKMGGLLEHKYLTPDMLFGVIPEMGRLLAVLIPLELAVREYYSNVESNPIALWDKPYAKWEFNVLWDKYQTWYEEKERLQRKFEQKQIDWDKVPSATGK